MQLDGLLAFLDGTVEVALAEAAAFGLADGVQGYDFGKIVLVAVLFFKRTVDVRHRTIIISIVPRGKRMPPTALRSVLLGRTPGGEKEHKQCKDGDYMSIYLELHVCQILAE